MTLPEQPHRRASLVLNEADIHMLLNGAVLHGSTVTDMGGSRERFTVCYAGPAVPDTTPDARPRCQVCGKPWAEYTSFDGTTTTNICRTTPNPDGTWNTHPFVTPDTQSGGRPTETLATSRARTRVLSWYGAMRAGQMLDDVDTFEAAVRAESSAALQEPRDRIAKAIGYTVNYDPTGITPPMYYRPDGAYTFDIYEAADATIAGLREQVEGLRARDVRVKNLMNEWLGMTWGPFENPGIALRKVLVP